MSNILTIDTSGQRGSVLLLQSQEIILAEINEEPFSHASFVQHAIEKIKEFFPGGLNDLHAVCVAAGPGSYTGIRVALAAAKGLCFALDIPLISLSALAIIAKQAFLNAGQDGAFNYVCAMTDARRQDVFCAIYNYEGKCLEHEQALTVDENFFSAYRGDEIIYTGSGAFKISGLQSFDKSAIIETVNTEKAMAEMAFEYFSKNRFSDLRSTVPLYAKAFYSPPPKNT